MVARCFQREPLATEYDQLPAGWQLLACVWRAGGRNVF